MIKGRGCTIAQLRKKLRKGKRLLCFGAGGRLDELCSYYMEDHLEAYIDYIFDNNEKKWRTKRKLGDCEAEIRNPAELPQIYTNNHILLITLREDEAVLRQINRILERAECYLTPIVGIQVIWLPYMTLKVMEGLCRILPLRRAIAFPGWGESQRENESALRDYLIEKGYSKKYNIIWACDGKAKKRQGYREVSSYAINRSASIKEIFAFYYWRATSKYIIFENQGWIRRRKKQIHIYLNHGTPPIKSTEGVIELPPDIDYAICSSPEIADIVSKQYSVDKEKLLYCGSPRFDHLFLPGKHIDILFPESRNFEKHLLWVPTFRQHNISLSRVDSRRTFPFGIPILEREDDFTRLNKDLEMLKIMLYIKPHPLQNLEYIRINDFSNIKLITQKMLDKVHVGVNCILKDMDAIITDYSTIAFDYMLLDRPLGYTIDDMEDYSLGFSVKNPLDWMPGEKIKDMGDLRRFLDGVAQGMDDYKVERNEIKKRIHMYQERDNCKRLVEMLQL